MDVILWAQTGNIAKFQEWLQKHTVSDCFLLADSEQRTVLHVATQACQATFLHVFLEATSPKASYVNRTDWQKWTALHYAIAKGFFKCAWLLIKYGADLDIRDGYGWSPLDLVMKGNFMSVNHQKDESEVYMWGINKNYLLGHPSADDLQYPERVSYFYHEKIIYLSDISMSKYHTLFLTSIGTVYACGVGHTNRMGLGHENTQIVPSQILFEETIVKVAAGHHHSMFLSSEGLVYTCGSNNDAQLGYSSTCPSNPRLVSLLFHTEKHITGIACSSIHSVAYTAHRLFCWGTNRGQLGIPMHPTDIRQNSPREVASRFFLENVIAHVVANESATFCLLENNDIVILSEYTSSKLPPGPTKVLRLVCNPSYVLAVSSKCLFLLSMADILAPKTKKKSWRCLWIPTYLYNKYSFLDAAVSRHHVIANLTSGRVYQYNIEDFVSKSTYIVTGTRIKSLSNVIRVFAAPDSFAVLKKRLFEFQQLDQESVIDEWPAENSSVVNMKANLPSGMNKVVRVKVEQSQFLKALVLFCNNPKVPLILEMDISGCENNSKAAILERILAYLNGKQQDDLWKPSDRYSIDNEGHLAYLFDLLALSDEWMISSLVKLCEEKVIEFVAPDVTNEDRDFSVNDTTLTMFVILVDTKTLVSVWYLSKKVHARNLEYSCYWNIVQYYLDEAFDAKWFNGFQDDQSDYKECVIMEMLEHIFANMQCGCEDTYIKTISDRKKEKELEVEIDESFTSTKSPKNVLHSERINSITLSSTNCLETHRDEGCSSLNVPVTDNCPEVDVGQANHAAVEYRSIDSPTHLSTPLKKMSLTEIMEEQQLEKDIKLMTMKTLNEKGKCSSPSDSSSKQWISVRVSPTPHEIESKLSPSIISTSSPVSFQSVLAEQQAELKSKQFHRPKAFGKIHLEDKAVQELLAHYQLLYGENNEHFVVKRVE